MHSFRENMMNGLEPFKWAGPDSEYAPLARPRSEIAARWRTERDHAALVGRAMQCRWLVCVLCAGSVMWAMEWPTKWPDVDVSWPELELSSPASLLSLPTVTFIWTGQPAAQAQSWRGQHTVTPSAQPEKYPPATYEIIRDPNRQTRRAAPMSWQTRSILLPNLTAAVSAAVRTPSDCVPPGAVALTFFWPNRVDMRRMQFQNLQAKCFLSRLVSIGFGKGTRGTDSLGAIVEAPDFLANPIQVNSVTWRQRDWMKWRMMLDALRAASSVLYFDTDVVLMRNPFEALGNGTQYDVRFETATRCHLRSERDQCALAPRFKGQDESKPTEASRCSVSTGLVWLRSAKLAERIISIEPNWQQFPAEEGTTIVETSRSKTFHGFGAGAILDELDAADRVMRGGNFTFCPLSSLQFASGCSVAPKTLTADRSLACPLVTYHASWCFPKQREKKTVMRDVVQGVPRARERGCNDEAARTEIEFAQTRIVDSSR